MKILNNEKENDETIHEELSEYRSQTSMDK